MNGLPTPGVQGTQRVAIGETSSNRPEGCLVVPRGPHSRYRRLPAKQAANSLQDSPAPGDCLASGRGENLPGGGLSDGHSTECAEMQVLPEDLAPAPGRSRMIQLTGKFGDRIRIPGMKEDVILLGTKSPFWCHGTKGVC